MNWSELLESEIDGTYRATEGLIKMVDEKSLAWKPSTGTNWMTVGQLLDHITSACGACIQGFVTGDWAALMGDSAAAGAGDGGDDGMLPSAEKMPSVKSVADAQKRLAADKKLALAMVEKAGEKSLSSTKIGAPWDPTEYLLGRQCLHMVGHLGNHRSQLFYYLKLQGKPVNTMHLYGG